ncbi:TPA: hypothetical protein N0F65_000961 [Lagenidium giganteum]|uniref:Uncharacterized protein n=1 Tax=Lagenidium giganteum TaxID=4803 RepID=A0AAV2YXD1_9STRA|nr:TPA: hypothetical protein N0F65_000961 [Lagenidium giganteum]
MSVQFLHELIEARERGFYVELPPIQLRCCWIVLVALHIGCATFYVGVAMLYQFLPSTALIWNIELYSLSINVAAYPYVVAVHAALAAGHVYSLLRTLWWSICHKACVFSDPDEYHRLRQQRHDTRASLCPVVTWWPLQYVWSLGHRAWGMLFGRRGFFGIESEFFEFRMVVRETIETGLQSYQCYHMSWLVSRMWLQRMFVAIIVINSWATPSLHLLAKNKLHLAHTRMLALTLDVLLDLVSTMVIPCVLASTHVLFMLWGVVVLITHIYAEFNTTSNDCVVAVHPWFRAKPGCALIELNSLHLSTDDDDRDDIGRRLAQFDELAVSYLILRHHASLSVPSNLQDLSNLVGLKMDNVSVVEWGADAALTNTHHPKLLFVFLVRVNVTSFPEGMMSSDFPQLFVDIEICVSTLSDLPSTLSSVWPAGVWLFVDHSNFTAVPEVAFEMKLSFLQLAYNKIHTIPPALFTNPALALIGLSGNPISSLPETFTAPQTPLELLSLDLTDMAVLPSWMDADFMVSSEVKDGIQRVQNRLHRRRHFSSTDPVLVELRMNLRVVLDIALQSYQCYRMSWYLSRMWLLRMYTAMLVINCWTNPLIQFVINHTKCSRKLIEARIVVDVLLDVMTVILVPCVLLHTYYQQFDVLRRDFPQSKQTSQDCVLVVRPWFRPKPGCALIEISGGNFSASQDPRDAVAQRLASFDEVAVSYLILSHHSALHVPHNIQNLHNLVGLKMKNVTLIEWGDDAAITQTHHPRGLLSKDFPPLLLDIEVCVSTLSDLPANLPSVWPAGAWLFLDHSNFTSVPDVALEMDLAFLTFAFNHIHEVPAAMFTNPMLSLIDVSGNPIAALPNVSAESLTPLGLLVLDATDLVTLPPWMTENFLVNTEVYLGNTPYCNALGAANQTARTINDQPLCRLQDDCRRLHQIL